MTGNMAKAIDTNNSNPNIYEHTIKLVYSSWKEFDYYRNDKYLDIVVRECATPSISI